jgi:hypothetical protein
MRVLVRATSLSPKAGQTERALLEQGRSPLQAPLV